jgi:hypothetical protein
VLHGLLLYRLAGHDVDEMVARRLQVEQIDPGVGSIFSTMASVLLGVLVGNANGIHDSGSSNSGRGLVLIAARRIARNVAADQ